MLYGYEVVRYTDRSGRENMCVRVSECELSVCTVRVQYSMCGRVWVALARVCGCLCKHTCELE